MRVSKRRIRGQPDPVAHPAAPVTRQLALGGRARTARRQRMADALLKTPLHPWHASHHGHLVEFAGWSLPTHYSSIVAEHTATRTAVGVFDVSHMGRLEFVGDHPLGAVGPTRDATSRRLKPGTIRYGLVTNDARRDPGRRARLSPAAPGRRHASADGCQRVNREKIVAWIRDHQRPDERVTLIDRSLETAMIAVQGPAAIGLVNPLVDADVSALRYYTGTITRCGDVEVIVSRTGYTGEDGCELIVPNDAAAGLWQRILDEGHSRGAVPVGLAARDTLRLEAGMPLYGHELSEQIEPFQAGLAFAVQLEDHEFLGREALVAAKEDRVGPVRVGLRLDGRRVPREKYSVLCDGRVAGSVTSGTFSPTFNRPIAMAYLAPNASQAGTCVAVDIRGRSEPAEVVGLPFYSRNS